jgi:3-oxoacyl-[acyl-carrier protein] reductase
MEDIHMTLVQEKPETLVTKRLAGKVAVVTGGSRGIGAAIALRLAQEGATVAITYTKNKKAAEDVVASISKLGNTAVAIRADVASASDTKHLVDELGKKLGKIDVLVNNAGVWEGGALDQLDLDQYQRIFDTNVKGVLATTLAALKLIPNGGRIINLSSVAAEVALPGMSVYSASKAALEALTRIWAQELGPRNITVNAVAPGTTVTDMFNDALPAEETKQAMIEKTALRRLGQPDDIAAVVAFLASKDGGWVTGQSIRADGGLTV